MSEEVSAVPKLEPSEPLVPKEPSQDDTKPRRPFPPRPAAADIVDQEQGHKHSKSSSFAPAPPSSATKPKRTATVGSQDKPTLPNQLSFKAEAPIKEEKTDLPALVVVPDYPTPNTIIPPKKGPESAIPASPSEQAIADKEKETAESPSDKPVTREPQPPPELRPQTGTAKSRVMSFLRTGSFAILKKPESSAEGSSSNNLEEKKKNRMSFFNPKKERSEKSAISGPVAATLPSTAMVTTAQSIPSTAPVASSQNAPGISSAVVSTQNIPSTTSVVVSSTHNIPGNGSSRQSVVPVRAGSVFISSEQNKKNIQSIERLEIQVKVLTKLVTGLVKDNRDLRERISKDGGEKHELSKSLESLINHGYQNGIEELTKASPGSVPVPVVGPTSDQIIVPTTIA